MEQRVFIGRNVYPDTCMHVCVTLLKNSTERRYAGSLSHSHDVVRRLKSTELSFVLSPLLFTTMARQNVYCERGEAEHNPLS